MRAGVQRELGLGALAVVRLGDHRMVAEIKLVELCAVAELLRREPLGLCAAGETTEKQGRIDGNTPPDYIFPETMRPPSAQRCTSDGPS